MSLVPACMFFLIMLALATMPSASVALVVSRSATLGFRNGAAVTGGIVVGDLILVGLSIFGMSSLAETMGGFFFIIRCMAGVYLILMGVSLLCSSERVPQTFYDDRPSTIVTSFVSGLLLTFGDLKAIFFYASLFPTLFELRLLTTVDVAIIACITILTVGGAKLIYAHAAQAILSRWNSQNVHRRTRKIAGGLMIGAGAYVIVKA